MKFDKPKDSTSHRDLVPLGHAGKGNLLGFLSFFLIYFINLFFSIISSISTFFIGLPKGFVGVLCCFSIKQCSPAFWKLYITWVILITGSNAVNKNETNPIQDSGHENISLQKWKVTMTFAGKHEMCYYTTFKSHLTCLPYNRTTKLFWFNLIKSRHWVKSQKNSAECG